MKLLASLIILSIFCSCSNAQSLKIMSYNIRYDNPGDGENRWENRKDLISHQLVEFKPDILGLQEALFHQVEYLDGFLHNHRYLGSGRDDGKRKGEFSPILYDTSKFEMIIEGQFWLSPSPGIVSKGWDAALPRICSYTKLQEKNNGQYFWVFNTHFDHIGKEARAQSVTLILDKIVELNVEKDPYIVMGDFNLSPEELPIQSMSKVMNDSKIVSPTSIGPKGSFNGFDISRIMENRIDYIFTSKNDIEVLYYEQVDQIMDNRYPSDHLPVYIEFKWINR